MSGAWDLSPRGWTFDRALGPCVHFSRPTAPPAAASAYTQQQWQQSVPAPETQRPYLQLLICTYRVYITGRQHRQQKALPEVAKTTALWQQRLSDPETPWRVDLAIDDGVVAVHPRRPLCILVSHIATGVSPRVRLSLQTIFVNCYNYLSSFLL